MGNGVVGAGGLGWGREEGHTSPTLLFLLAT